MKRKDKNKGCFNCRFSKSDKNFTNIAWCDHSVKYHGWDYSCKKYQQTE